MTNVPTITINPDDFGAFASAARRRIGSVRYLPSLVVVVVTAASVIVGSVFLPKVADIQPGTGLLFSLFIGSIIGLIACPRFVRFILWRYFDADGSFLEPKKFSFGADGFHVDGAQVRTFISWDAVQEVVDTETHFFIMIDRTVGVIVPKRCFVSPTDADAFVAEVKRHIVPKAI
jgi:YcxB-like protein